MEQLNFNFGLGGALPKGYTLSSYTFGQAINTIDIESVNIPENVKRKADFLDFLVTREYISEFPDNNPTKESEVAVGILDSYIENTNGQVMAKGGGVGNKKLENIKNRLFAKHKK